MCLPVEQLHSRVVAEFEEEGGTIYTEEMIDLDREAPQAYPLGHLVQSVPLTRLAIDLRGSCNRFGATRDLERSIVLHREALGLCPQGHPARSFSLNSLAAGLSTRYQQLGTIEDLDEAIVLGREALDLRPQGHRDRPVSLNNLAIDLSTRYQQLSVIQDLNEAIVLGREALDLRPQGHRDRSVSLNNLAIDLSTRYQQLSVIQDLNEAIVLGRKTLDLLPRGHPDRSRSVNNLAANLSTRYSLLGRMEDLNEAIPLGRELLDLRPQEHPARLVALNGLAAVLSARYKQLGGMDDLNEVIPLGREILDLCSQKHPARMVSLNGLAAVLSARYKQLGGMEHLDEAIVVGREALEFCPQTRPERSMLLNSLALVLSTRYKQLGVIEDLDEAVVLDREALDLCPRGHPDRSMSLNNLAAILSTRYKQLGETEDLDMTIVLCREGLALRSQGHPYRSMSLNNLAAVLSTRYKRLGGVEDLNEAIALAREALDLLPQGHPARLVSLDTLALVLSTQYKQLGAMNHLDEAIVLGREALDLCPHGHFLRSHSLNNLAHHLCDRFTHSGRSKDKEEVFSLYTQLAHVPQMVSFTDFSAARAWVRMTRHFQHSSTPLAYETSLRFLTQHLATLPPLPQHLAIFKNLTSSLAVDAFSACLHERAPALAVELLEQGRGVFWTQLARLRSPFDDLVIAEPKLADDYTRVALLILNALDSPSPDQHQRLCHLNVEMQRVVTNVRELPGFSRFLLPSLFPDLQRAASGGPVIIVNASKYSCDALIVLLDRDPVHIPLQITQGDVRDLSRECHDLTKRARGRDVTEEFTAFLRKLWDQIVSPIVDFLQRTLPPQSRIWWCPTAEFSALPLHAAGPYMEGRQNLADIYIPSYTPTLTALIRARRRDLSSSATRRKRFIAIGQANAVGANQLPSTGAELDIVGQRVVGLAAFTRIEGEECCISRVVEELGENDWVHLACPGLPNSQKPFESAFALCDGHFTIHRIIGYDLKNAEFAYLSSSDTTVGDEDEAIHLASAMQFAGFRSVIGTMWDVGDSEATKIAPIIYQYLVDGSDRLDHTRAAFALNKMMTSDVDVPLDQRIVYIHLGA